jgi:hypothetical protein
MEPQQDFRLKLPEIPEYRAAQAKRRAEAFCDAPEYVLGVEVRPLTPATFSMLLATGNSFICGGKPTELDVRHYLWIHAPTFCHCGDPARDKKYKAALRPLDRALCEPWRKLLGLGASHARYFPALWRAVVEIRQLVENAFADAGSASGRPGKPLATLEAFFIHEMAIAYHWVPERTRHTPLRQIIQLHRCIRGARGDEVGDEGEDNILASHLEKRNAALAAERAAQQKATT